MNDVSIWITEIREAAGRVAGHAVEYLPSLVGAALILLAGWLIARLVRSAAMKFAGWLNRVVDQRMGPERAPYLRLSNTRVALFANGIFWLIILIFVAAATRVLGLETFSAWLDQVVAYLPTLLAGGLIILVGFLVSNIAKDLTVATLASAGVAHADLMGRVAQAAILMTALILGINQIGIDVTLLIALIAIVVGGLVGSMTLAFAIGARELVRNLIGAHYLQQHYQLGQNVRIGDSEGEIVEFSPVFAVLATATGRVTIPAKAIMEASSTLLTQAAQDE